MRHAKMIREATDDDTPRLIDMAQHFLLMTPYGRMLTPTTEQLAAFVETIRTMGVIIVAERLARVEGMIGLVALPHPMDGTLYAEEIAWWVEPTYRGGSIGPRLLKAAELWARQKNARALKMVAPTGTTVGAFLTHHGYRAVETAYYKGL
jgi:GNAT superfamily N-acetyltransferase